MSVAAGRPPFLSNHDVITLLTNYFNFKKVYESSIKSFPSYRDRTYYFQGEQSDEIVNGYILKLNNPLSTPVEVIDGVNKVMKHLHSRGLLSPCPLVSSTGKDYIKLACDELTSETGNIDTINKQKYTVCVLSFIPGQVFDHVEKKFLTDTLLHEIGESLGKMDKELMVRNHIQLLRTCISLHMFEM